MSAVCGYCRAEFPDRIALIKHDIECHNGLERMRDGHRLICKGKCFCSLNDYEAVALSPGAQSKDG